jgi:hypothetical protein
MRRRVDSAHVLALIAIVLALGGNAVAFTLGKNSVGSKQLKKNAVTAKKIRKNAVTKAKIRKNAVTGVKVKKNSLTGSDINLNKLGTVPSANVAASLAALEATHLVGAPGEPRFEGGSANQPSEGGTRLQPVGFYKDHDGIVHLQGLARVGTGSPLPTIFTLPAGYRPADNTALYFNVLCLRGLPGNEPCSKDEGEDEEAYSTVIIAGSNANAEGVSLSGRVATGPKQTISLDGISFRAES